jgi:hypothetical protein
VDRPLPDGEFTCHRSVIGGVRRNMLESTLIELDRKIRQMHAALSSVASSDLSGNRPSVVAYETHVYVSVDFNAGSDPIALHNAATLLIANIASLKDYLKVWCKRTGATFNGDNLINTNRDVALIHDLWNTDKHAELTSAPRSGNRPKLGDVRTAIRLSSGTTADSGAAVTMHPQTGKLVTTSIGGGAIQIVLSAQILDESDQPMGDLIQTCENAANAWLSTMIDAGVAVP